MEYRIFKDYTTLIGLTPTKSQQSLLMRIEKHFLLRSFEEQLLKNN